MDREGEFWQKVCEIVSTDDTEAMQAVKIYKALGEFTRLKIARLLLVDEDKGYCAGAIREQLETVASSSLSHRTPYRFRVLYPAGSGEKETSHEQVLV